MGRPGSKGQRPRGSTSYSQKALETANHLDLGSNIQVSGTEGSPRKASLGGIVSGASGQRRTVTKQADAARGPLPMKESLLPELEKGAPYSGPRSALRVHEGAGTLTLMEERTPCPWLQEESPQTPQEHTQPMSCTWVSWSS